MNKEIKEVKANLEYLKKLFIMPDSPDKFIEFGQELLEMIHDFFKEKGGIHSSISLPELSHIFNQTAIPEDPGPGRVSASAEKRKGQCLYAEGDSRRMRQLRDAQHPRTLHPDLSLYSPASEGTAREVAE